MSEPLALKNDGPEANGATKWTAEHVRAIVLDTAHTVPVIHEDDFLSISETIGIWDAWPVQRADGHPYKLAGGVTLWMALAAPHFPDPDERHGHARIHLLQRSASGWLHLGPVMPDGFSPGSREWSGSAVLGDDGVSLDLYFTATGKRGEPELTFAQRLCSARATLKGTRDSYRFEAWHDLREIVQCDPAFYMASDSGGGGPGTIKAFRDPAYFRNPVSGAHHILFAGSLAGSRSAFNGVVGAAVASPENPTGWSILPPLICADALNNELERPHFVFHDARYYLFWSTQSHVFDPLGPVGPTGLYGMVSERLDGTWTPLNGTGLVFANPPEAPAQAYSWLVLPDLTVTSFLDNWGPTDGGSPRRFGATFAPDLRLELDGVSARLVP